MGITHLTKSLHMCGEEQINNAGNRSAAGIQQPMELRSQLWKVPSPQGLKVRAAPCAHCTQLDISIPGSHREKFRALPRNRWSPLGPHLPGNTGEVGLCSAERDLVCFPLVSARWNSGLLLHPSFPGCSQELEGVTQERDRRRGINQP